MLCSINDPNCDKVAITRGWCGTHYQRWRIHGDPLYGGPVRRVRPQGMTEAEAFAWHMPGDPPFTDSLTEGCWDWAGSTSDFGHGVIQFRNTSDVRAHVASHRIYNLNDPLTEDKPCVLHWCDRPICVQPVHLHAGTRAENSAEMVERERSAFGERHWRAKLIEAQVLWIRAQTGMTQQAMADILGVNYATVNDVIHGRTWNHLL